MKHDWPLAHRLVETVRWGGISWISDPGTEAPTTPPPPQDRGDTHGGAMQRKMDKRIRKSEIQRANDRDPLRRETLPCQDAYYCICRACENFPVYGNLLQAAVACHFLGVVDFRGGEVGPFEGLAIWF